MSDYLYQSHKNPITCSFPDDTTPPPPSQPYNSHLLNSQSAIYFLFISMYSIYLPPGWFLQFSIEMDTFVVILRSPFYRRRRLHYPERKKKSLFFLDLKNLQFVRMNSIHSITLRYVQLIYEICVCPFQFNYKRTDNIFLFVRFFALYKIRKSFDMTHFLKTTLTLSQLNSYHSHGRSWKPLPEFVTFPFIVRGFQKFAVFVWKSGCLQSNTEIWNKIHSFSESYHNSNSFQFVQTSADHIEKGDGNGGNPRKKTLKKVEAKFEKREKDEREPEQSCSINSEETKKWGEEHKLRLANNYEDRY